MAASNLQDVALEGHIICNISASQKKKKKNWKQKLFALNSEERCYLHLSKLVIVPTFLNSRAKAIGSDDFS